MDKEGHLVGPTTYEATSNLGQVTTHLEDLDWEGQG